MPQVGDDEVLVDVVVDVVVDSVVDSVVDDSDVDSDELVGLLLWVTVTVVV